MPMNVLRKPQATRCETSCLVMESEADRIMERTPHETRIAPFADSAAAREPMDAVADPLRTSALLSPQALTASGRRAFLGIATLFTLAACAPKQTTAISSAPSRPDGIWDSGPAAATTARASAPTQPKQIAKAPATALVSSGGPAALAWAKPRGLWAKGAPEIALMNPMLPVTSITVHHDGLDKLVTGTGTQEMADRIDLYRVGHRAKGWGDIGYHLIIDRSGALWQGRSIRFQGAHVKNRNEGNIGVLVMGNFQIQQPTKAQLTTLTRVLTDLRMQYHVAKPRIYSHREWKGAATSCPGDKLQLAFAKIRVAQRA
ncbi:MAG: N-acetylmuramoyl-L-alanine amidase [Phycisphaerales bacterium]|nr:N-acetylmuramoyl-L-alanine amidase [Phycisphaerales bacterium]